MKPHHKGKSGDGEQEYKKTTDFNVINIANAVNSSLSTSSNG